MSEPAILFEWSGSKGEPLALFDDGMTRLRVAEEWLPTDAVAPVASEVMRGIQQFANSHGKYKERAELSAHLCELWRRWIKMLLDGKAPHSGQRVIIASEIHFFDNNVAGWIRETKATSSP